jgi:hypothetical protein
MNTLDDPVVLVLNEIIRADGVMRAVTHALARVVERLDASPNVMAWDIVPLTTFGARLPANIGSAWIFVIRANSATGAERHPNSHQRSFSLIGSGRFEVRGRADWRPHPLVGAPGASIDQRWVSIPPSTWHQLFVGSETWGMLSFHTVAAEELIEERPVDADNLLGRTHQERYAHRQA